ncbi:MAG: aspartate/glutamate racemase family protein [Anaerolineae bacterium]
MGKRLAVLHTSFVFINVETMISDLFKELLPSVEILDFVDGQLLASVMQAGRVTDTAVRRMCHLAGAAEESGADLILSACSSLGPAIDVARRFVDTPIVKIDDAMARRAAEMAERVGVLATVPTTLGPTAALIGEQAAAMRKVVDVRTRLAEGAFPILMSGDRQRHDAMVTEAATALAGDVDVLVLAQASMTRLAPSLAQRTGLPVLSSPRLGIEDVRRLLEQMGDA